MKKNTIKLKEDEQMFGLSRRDNREGNYVSEYNLALKYVLEGLKQYLGCEINPNWKADIEFYVKNDIQKYGKVNVKQMVKSLAEFIRNKYGAYEELYESKLSKIISKNIKKVLRESVNEYFSNEKNPTGDGRYAYQGTGSPESEERINKIGRKYAGYHNNSHGESMFDKETKEYGGREFLPYDHKKENFDNTAWIYHTLRDFAGKRISKEDFDIRIKHWVKTPEDAEAFIKYLHTNGFKTIKL